MSKIFGGRYEVLERIGVGGMAIVYKAKDLLLNRIVTIKVLKEQFANDEDFVRRFRREAQSAASLSHSNIVSIYDVGKDGDTDYIVMEFIEGRNLKDVIRNYAPLSTEQTVNLAVQIGEAIRHAHEHHIIHRDIKPQNILVTADGRAKVTDFGIARAVSSATVTHTGDIVGSVHYLSPEQAKGVQSNEQSDIYSLGIILYELLTGKVPYDGETPISIALKHLQEKAVLPSKINPRTSHELEAVILKAISKAPEQRYQSVKELLEDLRSVQAGRPAVKARENKEEDLDNTRVHRSLVPDVASALPKTETKENKTRKRKWLPWVVILTIFLLFVGGGAFWLRSYVLVDTVKVPKLVGFTIPDAAVFVKQAQLQLDPDVKEEYSNTVEKGKIIGQEPQAETHAKVGRSVKLVVSKGPEMKKFPDVKRDKLSKEDAEYLIRNQGFTGKINFETDPNSALPAGTVVDQNPAPDSMWPINDDIRIRISQGPQNQTINMPNVIGKSVSDARAILEGNKLVVVIDSQDSTIYPRDVVMGTNPKPGEPVQQGAQVIMTVSRGPGPLASLDRNLTASLIGLLIPSEV
ncbi:MAG: Stk1 family PASTA domain-containing Ser/Thr kinase [Desulfitobacterium hafniense]|nr:Stk1 family PASTA domain-containing Ser/Thr kinase [Desulfitobacterium hafniense]